MSGGSQQGWQQGRRVRGEVGGGKRVNNLSNGAIG